MDKKIKIQIKNRFTGNIIFEYEKTNNDIKETLHEAIKNGADLCDADLCDADLCDANLCGANLCDADLCDADLCDANLCDADLCDADLRGANLCDADLRGADLCDADLRGADLRGADLCGANLRDADLRGANLCDADLRGSVIGYSDNINGYDKTELLINKIQIESNLILTKVYENHDSYSSRWGAFWKNLIIIREWEVKGSQKINLSDDEKEVIRGFSKINNLKELQYNCHRSCNQHAFTGYTDDGSDAKIELPGEILELKNGKTYTLKDLGIE